MTQDELIKQISDKIDDPRWIDGIEQQIISHIQDRITAKFANLSTVPDLVATVKYNVASLFQEGYLPDLKTYVDSNLVKNTIEQSVSAMIERTIDNLILDPVWLTKIEVMIKQQMVLRVLDNFAKLDFDKIVREQIDQGIQRWQDRLRENFSSTGIKDSATEIQLTILDDGIVATNGIAAQDLLIEKEARVNGTLIVSKLAVIDGMNSDAPGWLPVIDNIATRTFDKVNETWRESLVKEVLNLAQSKGIEFDQVLIKGSPIFEGDRLNPAIKVSGIERTGTLRELSVEGPVNLNNSVRVVGSRLGVNTESPEMALSVWDEEVSVIAGKISQQRAYIGTGRAQGLSIGINRVPQIDISADGLTTIKNLCVGRHRIGHADQVPGYSGTRGDMVFNSNPRTGEPFAWQCLGGFQWQPLKAS